MYYPRSFLKFILLGFLLVSLPLVYALGELILSLDRLQTQSEHAVQQAAQAGRASRQLYEHGVTLERLGRQYLILEDGALLEDYGRVRQEFRQTARQLSQLPLESPAAVLRLPLGPCTVTAALGDGRAAQKSVEVKPEGVTLILVEKDFQQ